MDEKELESLLDALFPGDTGATQDASHSTTGSQNSGEGLGYKAKLTEDGHKVLEAFRRLDGSERKSAAMKNTPVQRALSGPASTHTGNSTNKANAARSTPTASVAPKESQSRSKLTKRPALEPFLKRILSTTTK